MTSRSEPADAGQPSFDVEAGEREVLGKPPRVPPLEGPEVVAAALENTGQLRNAASRGSAPVSLADVPEVVTTLLRHPDLYQRVSGLSIQLLGSGRLTARDRELAILRTGWLCQAPYEWGEHVRMAKAAGVTSEEIERLTQGSSAPGRSDYEAALIRAAEELNDDAMISDQSWQVLAQHLDEQQLIELPVLIGQFTMVAYLQNALRLRLAPDNVGLSAR